MDGHGGTNRHALSGLEKSVLDIQSSLSRINWLIITGIIAVLLQGGFAAG